MKLDHLSVGLKGSPSQRAVAEAEFCRAWLAERQHAYAVRCAYIAIILNIASLIILPTFVTTRVLPSILTGHGVALVGLLFAIWRRRDRPMFLAVWNAVCFLLAGLYVGICAYDVRLPATPREIMLATAGLLGYGTFASQFSALTGFRLVAQTTLLSVASMWAMAPSDAGLIWGGIACHTFGFNVLIRFVLEARVKDEARREFRFRNLIAPMHIVRNTPPSTTMDFAREFGPEHKYCVCISSDWRNYQAISASMPASQLTMSLSEYYNLCESLLNTHFPLGNYYSDWIADELFLVVFPVEGSAKETLIEKSLAFAEDLIRGKRDFVRIHGVPKAIDIGISAGESLIGIMGPDGHRKATSLGEVPGRSRRLQSTGKLLRKSLTDADRVIFGSECLMRLKEPRDVLTYALKEHEGVRDLEDREVFFLEPVTTGGGETRRVA